MLFFCPHRIPAFWLFGELNDVPLVIPTKIPIPPTEHKHIEIETLIQQGADKTRGMVAERPELLALGWKLQLQLALHAATR